MILLDTSTLSVVFRRKIEAGTEGAEARAFRGLVAENAPLSVPGIVVQELLSGVKTPEQTATLRERIEGLPLVLATRDDHYRAADIFNQCQSKGIAAATVDCLIAATALTHKARLWTLDQDFPHIARVCHLNLFKI